MTGSRRFSFWINLIAAGAMILLLAAIGVSYLLIARIFDTKIAAVTALLMLLCGLLWRFAQSGLPQPLMLFLFSFAMYFSLQSGRERASGPRRLSLGGAVRIVFRVAGAGPLDRVLDFHRGGDLRRIFPSSTGSSGAGDAWRVPVHRDLVAAAGELPRRRQPDGLRALSVLLGSCGGIGRHGHAELQPRTGTASMQTRIPAESGLRNGRQLVSIFTYLGGIIAAPLFFVSLLHPFKRTEISQFRWAILLMWVWAAIGMAIFGIPEGESDADQIDVLFIPLMTAYGLALLSVLWSRPPARRLRACAQRPSGHRRARQRGADAPDHAVGHRDRAQS